MRGSEQEPRSTPTVAPPSLDQFREAFLAEIRRSKVVFYNTVIAQAQRIELDGDRVTLSFSPNQRVLRDNCEQNRALLESILERVAGRKLTVVAQMLESPVGSNGRTAAGGDDASTRKAALREQALADAGVQALLEVFPAEIRDVEEM
jgi:hypothetical protein